MPPQNLKEFLELCDATDRVAALERELAAVTAERDQARAELGTLRRLLANKRKRKKEGTR